MKNTAERIHELALEKGCSVGKIQRGVELIKRGEIIGS